jgi:endonuclease-3
MTEHHVHYSLSKKAARADRLLSREYGVREWRPGGDPVDTLVETILSQNTTDTNSHRAFLRLKEEFSHWSEVMDAPSEAVADVIRSGGLADIKARRIQAALRTIVEERGEITLDFLADVPVSDAEAWLTSMEGVGPKTAAIVLLFSFGMPSFPVDTHVHRVSSRLGLVSPGTGREKAQMDIAELIPEDRYYSFHLNLIEHGRRICRPRRPSCGSCVLSSMCDGSRRIA